jgi:hypothetical protein
MLPHVSPGYEIRIEGRLSDTASSRFERFTASVRPAETIMRGEVRDQSELLGLLEQVQALGLDLLEVRQLDDEERRRRPLRNITRDG